MSVFAKWRHHKNPSLKTEAKQRSKMFALCRGDMNKSLCIWYSNVFMWFCLILLEVSSHTDFFP